MCDIIKEIYNVLIEVFINGYVGYRENIKIFVRWKMRFRNYYKGEVVEKEGDVLVNFDYLVVEKLLFLGYYDIFKEIFVGDFGVI